MRKKIQSSYQEVPGTGILPAEYQLLELSNEGKPSVAIAFIKNRCALLFILTLSLFFFNICSAQTTDSFSIKKRTWAMAGGQAAFYAGSLLALNQAWYANYPSAPLHSFDDSREWLQVDKTGHAWTAYQLSRGTYGMWKWATQNEKKAALLSGISSLGYMTVIEFLDGKSAEWGWSWSDIGANITGTGLFLSQQLVWKEQRIYLKWSFHPGNYSEPDLKARANQLFGKSWYEQMLKDYNTQTYWLSANIHSFFKDSKIPKWLNLSIGYGADGLWGGEENIAKNAAGQVTFDRTDIKRIRQFYLAPDIDFTRIPTKKKWLKTVFYCLNSLKMPAPALMLNSSGKLKGYFLYF